MNLFKHVHGFPFQGPLFNMFNEPTYKIPEGFITCTCIDLFLWV